MSTPNRNKNQKIFQARLRELRGAATQEEFSRKYGVRQVTWGRYELGEREPDLETLTKICQTEMVSADWLLGLESSRGATHVTASGHAVAANHSTVTTPPPELPRLLGIIESQQRVIDRLSAALEK